MMGVEENDVERSPPTRKRRAGRGEGVALQEKLPIEDCQGYLWPAALDQGRAKKIAVANYIAARISTCPLTGRGWGIILNIISI
jgi:hypothetical protein